MSALDFCQSDGVWRSENSFLTPRVFAERRSNICSLAVAFKEFRSTESTSLLLLQSLTSFEIQRGFLLDLQSWSCSTAKDNVNLKDNQFCLLLVHRWGSFSLSQAMRCLDSVLGVCRSERNLEAIGSCLLRFICVQMNHTWAEVESHVEWMRTCSLPIWLRASVFFSWDDAIFGRFAEKIGSPLPLQLPVVRTACQATLRVQFGYNVPNSWCHANDGKISGGVSRFELSQCRTVRYDVNP